MFTARLPSSRVFSRLLRVVLGACLLLGAGFTVGAPALVVSIKPLELLAAPVLTGFDPPRLLIGNDHDPHHLALRPSERRALDNADLVLWAGPMLEVPLERVLRDIGTEVLTIQDLPGIHLLNGASGPDPHVWLDTRNARIVARALARSLATQDSANAARYEENARVFMHALDELDAELQALFAGLDAREWAVYHHALRYFQSQWGLQEPLTLADSDNNPPGIRSVVALREKLASGTIRCLLIEPDVNEEQLRNLLAPASPQLIRVDLLGHESGATTEAYLNMLRALGQALGGCLRD